MYVVMAVVSPLLEARDVNAVSASWNFGSSEVTRRWGDISTKQVNNSGLRKRGPNAMKSALTTAARRRCWRLFQDTVKHVK